MSRESDPERLRELVLNINMLLNMIEDQVANLRTWNAGSFQEVIEPLISPYPVLANAGARFKTSWQRVD
jgi:hypothetical protein